MPSFQEQIRVSELSFVPGLRLEFLQPLILVLTAHECSSETARWVADLISVNSVTRIEMLIFS